METSAQFPVPGACPKHEALSSRCNSAGPGHPSRLLSCNCFKRRKERKTALTDLGGDKVPEN